jgi:hypothetical protein
MKFGIITVDMKCVGMKPDLLEVVQVVNKVQIN